MSLPGALRRASALVFVLLFCLSALAQAPATRSDEEKRQYRQAMEQADQKIADEVTAHSQLVKNLEYLTTEIGPRLTGTPQMQKASQWTLQEFQKYGLDAHLETFQIAQAWTRGVDTAEIAAPIQRRVRIRSFGWSKATPGEITAPVVYVKGSTLEDYQAFRGKLKGAIVIHDPSKLPPENEVPENAYDAVIAPRHGVPPQRSSDFFRQRQQINKFWQDEGVAVLLTDSGKTDSLINMGSASQYKPSEIPMAFVSHENYSLLYRLAQAGPVTMTINLTGTFSKGPVPASVTVAQIKGSEHPDEQVILGAHLDSWDLGQGALDNGTGAMAVLEAARTLKALGWQPKRTITFLLFYGEEQGLVGSREYVKKHEAEMPKVDAMLVHDTGTGKVFSIALQDLYETASLMTEIYTPIEEVFDMQPLSTRIFGSSDHVPFGDAGVPAYFCIQKPAHYREAHHTQTDTFDKVIPDEVNEGAAVLASWAWNVSEMPESLPHHAARQGRGE
ncbi:MAG TPA: M20/M25/M40 family metallo-hydrolase [Terriglobales bacterium]|nr:M20/M25/M40 family metallo-hydrolase [Terriglobales bacterium]